MMHSKRVWYPGRSVAASQDMQDGCEEGGRGWTAAAPEAKFRPKENATSKATKQTYRREKVLHKEPATAVSNCRPRTVACGARHEAATSESGDGEGQSYSTIEQRSWTGNATLLECGDKKSEHLSKERPDFCGWTESEYPLKHTSNRSSVPVSSTVDRSSLQTPGPESCRTNLPSRAGSRLDRSSLQTPATDNRRSTVPSRAGSRNSHGRSEQYEFRNFHGRSEHYEFRHLAAAHEYIEDYRRSYCYSILCYRPPPPPITESANREEEDENLDNFMPLGVKGLYHGDPYLRELASRLGVRTNLKTREQHLLKTHRPTPPSIVKKRKEVADLAVCAHGHQEETEGNRSNDSEKSSKDNFEVNAPKTSLPLPGSAPTAEASPLELPAIARATPIPQHHKPHKESKSNSVISVAKYLRVSSHPQQSVTPPREPQTLEDKESLHSLIDDLSSGSTLTAAVLSELLDEESPVPETQGMEDVRRARFSFPEHLPLLDDDQKERLIAQKAHALGLLSRGWSKAPHVRRIMGNYIREDLQEAEDRLQSRPVTCGTRTKRRVKTDQEPSDLSHSKKMANVPTRAGSEGKREQRPKTQQSRSAPDSSKLERLKSIYKPSDKPSLQDKRKETSQRQPSAHRCESRLRSRPNTRLQMYANDAKTRDKDGTRGCPSRPLTRLDRRKATGLQGTERREGQLPTATIKEYDPDEDCYWNELPSRMPSRPGTRHGQPSSFQASTRPGTRNGVLSRLGGQNRTSATVGVRLRRPQPKKWSQQMSVPRAESIQHDTSPNQISAHVERVRKKLEGVLDVHQRKPIPA